MHILVLGSAAGGGFPQWNSNSGGCNRARREPSLARTQSSLAVSSDGVDWFLLNASPDLRQQINDRHQLHPRLGKRHSPINGVVLTNADVDHVTGLLTLRESQAFTVYGSSRVLGTLAANSIFNVLNPEFVTRSQIALDEPFALTKVDGSDSGLRVEAFAVPGKVALYLEDASAGPGFGTQEGDTIGLHVTQPESGAHFFYIPGCAAMPAELAARLKGAPLVFFDGTLFRDDEMLAAKEGIKTGQRMGHLSMAGDDGTMAAFKTLGVNRRIFIHINNTNPALLPDTPERKAVEAEGWEIAWDGMEVEI